MTQYMPTITEKMVHVRKGCVRTRRELLLAKSLGEQVAPTRDVIHLTAYPSGEVYL